MENIKENMPPAAIIKSKTRHKDLPLSPGSGGSPTVKIGGFPAWRAITDFHSCPLSDGSKPHIGGRVMQGSTKVFIDNYPAARVGDKVVEATPTPNNIYEGDKKVKVIIK